MNKNRMKLVVAPSTNFHIPSFVAIICSGIPNGSPIFCNQQKMVGKFIIDADRMIGSFL
jgi:hypothetical protein